MNKEELEKLIKSKPKNLNVGELYAANYQGVINMKKLQTPGLTSFSERIKLEFDGEVPEGSVKI